MQTTFGQGGRKLIANSSVPVILIKPRINYPNEQQTITSKPTIFRRTDHTEDKYSEISHSEPRNQQQFQMKKGKGKVTNQTDVDEGRLSTSGLKHLSSKQENLVELRERLKNIHHFYRIRIEEQRAKNIERNQIFIPIIQQLQKIHNDKIEGLQKQLGLLEGEKQQIGLVDDRMIEIKNTIEDILKQSQQLKMQNEQKQQQIQQKQLDNRQKQRQVEGVKEELDSVREKIEQFERLKLKQNRRMKELFQMLSRAESSHRNVF